MSVCMGELVSDTLRALRRTGSEEDKASVERMVNRFYYDICRSIPVKELRRRIEVDLSDEDYDNGMWLPSNLADILRVKDVDDDFDYIHRDRAAVDDVERSWRYYDYIPTDGALASGEDAIVQKGATTFTSAMTDDHTGEYIKFGKEPGFYLLTAAKTFTPAYNGKRLDQANYVIRPMGTRKIICLDKTGDEETGNSIYVDYWEMPPPLYLETDMPLLPSTRALELYVMREAMLIIGKRTLSATTFERDIDKAMADLRRLNPVVSAPLHARDVMGEIFQLNTDPFGER